MENLTCKGLSAAHRRMLIKCITEEIGSIPEPVEIEFMEPFDGNSIHRYGTAARSLPFGFTVAFLRSMH